MRAQVLYGVNQLRYEENYQEPKLREGEALIKVKACGICGSDIDRVLKNGTYHFPTIIGHEFSGTVVSVFDTKYNSLIGKNYSIFPLIPCGSCDSCKRRNFQLCENYNYLGSRCDGGFAEYVSVPVWNLLEIPNGVSFEEAAMLEPAAVALHCLKLAGSLEGKTVLITGAGTISSILVQLALAKGAKNVILFARNDRKMAFIKSTCETITLVNSEDSNFIETIKSVNKKLPEIVIEGTGNEIMISKALEIIDRQGIVVLMGNPSGDVHLEKKVYWQILRKEIVLKGTWNSSYGSDDKNDWRDVFDLIIKGQLKLNKLITHKLELSQLYDGILLMHNKKELTNKVMVKYE